MTAPIEAVDLSMRYGRRTWALRDCALSLQAGHVAALVGPNGAGKTTLLHLAAGFLRPSAGRIEVLGRAPWPQAAELMAGIGFLAQDHPLYRSFTVEETLTMGRRLNRRWDGRLVAGHLERLRIPMDRQGRPLSGGPQAPGALALAMGKRAPPRLLPRTLAPPHPPCPR